MKAVRISSRGGSLAKISPTLVRSAASLPSGVLPHTHLRGKSFEYTLVYPDGRSEFVLWVPTYDFDWQTEDRFAAPLAVPKGSRLEATAHYDNSRGTRSNPDPTAEVRWGDQTGGDDVHLARLQRRRSVAAGGHER